MSYEIANEIIGMEKAALERWSHGDPHGFLDICARDVVYLDPAHDRPIDGLDALTGYYDSLKNQIRIDRYEIVDPKVQVYGNVAVMTFHYLSEAREDRQEWNCTEVYTKNPEDRWRIVHTHWSRTK